MATPMFQKSRILAMLFGCILFVLNIFALFLATSYLFATVETGYEMYHNDSYLSGLEGDYHDADTALLFQALTQDELDQLIELDDGKPWYLIGLYGTLTAIKFIYTFIQLCGLYLLLKATKMSTKTSEAIIEVNIHLLIQILFLGRDGLYIIKFMLEGSCSFIRDETFEFVPLEIFLCRFVSILAVNLFRSELLAAKAAAEEIPMAIPEIRDI